MVLYYCNSNMDLISIFSSLNINWLDIAIILVYIFFALEGFGSGFIRSAFDFVGFILSFVLALHFYSVFGDFLFNNIALAHGVANAIGFFASAALFELILNIVFRKLGRNIGGNFTSQDSNREKFFAVLNHFLGIIPGLASATILLSFLLSTILSFPSSQVIKQAISQSKIGSFLVDNTQGMEQSVNQVFGGAISETLNFFTIEPQSNESINLKFIVKDAKVDNAAEEKMFQMVNSNRAQRDLQPLVLDVSLTNLAREHSNDMFKRGYFSHYTPDGLSPFDRMAEANISYSVAGENLALAPNVDLAMQGLMNSPGHRANILSTEFHKIGIGVLDGGVYGEMFTQEFTN